MLGRVLGRNLFSRNSKIGVGREFHCTNVKKIDLISVVGPGHDFLQNIHSLSGLQWHLFIPLTTIALRTAFTLPISVMNRIRSRKQMQLQPLLSGIGPILKGKLASSKAARDGLLSREQIEVLTSKEKRNYRVKLFKKFNCQTWKSLVLLPTVQIPLWITMSLIIRSMCGWSVIDGIPIESAFQNDSFLWYNNLIESDPYFVLPLSIGAVGVANVEWNSLNTVNPAARQQKELQRTIAANRNDSNTILAMSSQTSSVSGPNISSIISNILRGGTIVFMTIALQAPTALCLYWLSSNTYSLIQNILLDKFLPLSNIPPKLKISDQTLQLQSPSQP